MERSWQTLYGTEPLLPQRYDRQRAAGYICSCPPGTTGENALRQVSSDGGAQEHTLNYNIRFISCPTYYTGLLAVNWSIKRHKNPTFQVKEPDRVRLSYTRLDEVGKTASCSLLRATVALTQVAK